jgi:hypothetical protein
VAILDNDDIKSFFPDAGTVEMDPSKIRDISDEVLDDRGRIQVLPAEYWASTTQQERMLFGHRHGIYGFPTVELVERLEEIIGQQSAIEIGAGHGVLAEALGIPATDSKQQLMAKYRFIYAASGQPPVKYGSNVEELHASRAVRKHKPDVAIGSWVTHKWDVNRPEAGGNEAGIDLRDILLNCKKLVLIGNRHVHRNNGLWDRPHTMETPDWLYSRKHNDEPDFIATWKGYKR